MGVDLPPGYFWDPQLRLGQETSALTRVLWPNYLIEDSDIPEPSLKFEMPEREMNRRFPVWGIRRASDRKLAAYANGVLLHCDPSVEKLPETGWRHAIDAVFSKTPPNCLCLLVANVDPEQRNLGLSVPLLDMAKQVTKKLGFSQMIGPVRPIRKSEFPDLSMSDYVSRLTGEGESFDPWVREHVRAGAAILNICSESVLVRATLAKWRQWIKLPLTESGEYELPGGLAPLVVDVAANVGVYREPNVWVRYQL